ncbi:MAG: MerR family transcriptional regulator [Clostridia bacterium]|nr:MerR family transcriptional regulator [Clostridia bacterium]
MMTVHEVSKLTGVSVRALHHYDELGLLKPASVTEAGYRLYDEDSLVRLQSILLFRELQFPLKDIGRILDSPAFDRNKALDQQIHLLELQREHIDNLIDLAKGIRFVGVKHMTTDFRPFDTKKIDEYAREAKASWGNTPEWKEYEQKSKGRTKEQTAAISEGMMDIFQAFGAIRDTDPAGPQAQAPVERLQAYITEHYYTCSDQILLSLSKMYDGGGSMTESIDSVGGPGTGDFAAKAIAVHCKT